MKNNKLGWLLLVMMATTFHPSCSKQKDDLTRPIVNLGGVLYEPNAIDSFAMKYFLPYNIMVVHRWEPTAVPVERKVVPVDEEIVMPILSTILEMWLQPYLKLAPPGFMKVTNFRKIVLVGGTALNSDRTTSLATADGGINITFYNLNKYNPNDMRAVNEMGHIMHHEYTHILNQLKAYSVEFERITPAYDNNWTEKTAWDRINNGFMGPYASANAAEDFAEMTSIMLTAGKPIMDLYFASATNTDATKKLHKKEQVVVDYFGGMGIDFYALQAEVNRQLKRSFPNMESRELSIIQNADLSTNDKKYQTFIAVIQYLIDSGIMLKSTIIN